MEHKVSKNATTYILWAIIILAILVAISVQKPTPAKAAGMDPPITFNTSWRNNVNVYAYTKPKCKGDKVAFGPNFTGAWGYASVRLHKGDHGKIDWIGKKKTTRLRAGKCKPLVKPVFMIYARKNGT